MKTANVKVDVIYIDPPYNTGKEFIYNDDFSTKKIVGSDDPHKHSKWLSFIKKRLQIAKDLLSDDGVIFVSIDDNEQAYLKVLMDEIFGEENFISNFIWQRTHHTNKNNSGKKIFRNAEYIISYAKNKNNFLFIHEGIKTDFETAPLLNKANLEKILIFKKGSVFLKQENKYNENDLIIKFKSRWSQNRIDNEIKNGTTFIIKSNKTESIRSVYSKNKTGFNVVNQLLNTSRLFEYYKEPTTENGTYELSDLGIIDFSYPKPINLIKYFLSITLWHKPNALILDFFAGSGTLGQAVMELNQEDGGKRKFILVTNNENNIAKQITRERIYRVIKGCGSNNQTIKWKYSKDQKSLTNNSVKYLQVKLVHKQNGDFEDIDSSKQLYLDEFNKELSIKDFKE